MDCLSSILGSRGFGSSTCPGACVCARPMRGYRASCFHLCFHLKDVFWEQVLLVITHAYCCKNQSEKMKKIASKNKLLTSFVVAYTYNHDLLFGNWNIEKVCHIIASCNNPHRKTRAAMANYCHIYFTVCFQARRCV